MDKEFFDKIFDQMLEEASTVYVENEEINNEEVEKMEFSELHKEKMKKLFKEVRRNENRKKAVRLTKRIAVVVLCALLITAGLITSVEAWRKEVVKFIMKNNDDNYMSIKFGDTTVEESGENETESGETEENNQLIIDDIKFLYLPEGFEYKNKEIIDKMIYYVFTNR